MSLNVARARATAGPLRRWRKGLLAIHDLLLLLEVSDAGAEGKGWAIDSVENACRTLARAHQARCAFAVSSSGPSASLTVNSL